uniref:Uncharacterized protein n=1 Tax=Pararge aegeria TaxID=116150 RepID=S4NMG6_9NEOP
MIILSIYFLLINFVLPSTIKRLRSDYLGFIFSGLSPIWFLYFGYKICFNEQCRRSCKGLAQYPYVISIIYKLTYTTVLFIDKTAKSV